ncbi:MAG: hypothetical protein JWL90_1741 [Chthoniobacteraceae bacterium]|nr:hypothetical protein [Chthoniobacteraceae bacterium]
MGRIFERKFPGGGTQDIPNAAAGMAGFLRGASPRALADFHVLFSQARRGALKPILFGKTPPALVDEDNHTISIQKRNMQWQRLKYGHLAIKLAPHSLRHPLG